MKIKTIKEKVLELLEEVLKGKFGTKNRAELIMRLKDLCISDILQK
jgi:hypothetical protein